jgi:F0F1-type ATP synthase membrane subunit c/vacuolar-type H+-ATPase subunit K
MKKFSTLFILINLTSIPLYASILQDSFLSNSLFIQIMLILSFVVISIGVLSSGYALSISLGAYAACESKNKKSAFVPAIMPGSQGIYSFVINFMMIQALADKPIQVIFAGIVCGLPCLYSALGQAKTAAACIKSINNEQMNLGEALIATAIPELSALTGLAAAFLTLNLA